MIGFRNLFSAIRHSSIIGCTLLAAGALADPGVPQKAGKIDFNRDIRPILSENCFACHGMDANKREADLRLDIREEAVKAKAFVPGDLAHSESWARILSDDEDEVMPPPETKKSLSAVQKDLLKRWIESGAEYAEHWAFIPPVKPALPVVPGGQLRTAVDNFVQAKLAAENLKPSGPASKAAWLRRVTLDLTGLPPTLEEMDAFEADSSPLAGRKVVDRLLASPAYGEHMAVDWLDVARYADTFGRHEDADCITWPYRDWVIKALNRNLPYDQFITEQMAGDLLPNPDEDQLIATAFNRLAQQSNEAGSDAEEFRIEQVADRVKTNGIAFLGLSMECARCHDHKYDPISMKDYYSMAAFVNNIDELGLFGVYVGASPPPTLPLYSPEQKAKRAELLQRMAELEKRMGSEQADARLRFTTWLEKNEPPFNREPGWLDRIGAWFVTPPARATPRKPLANYRFENIKDKVLVNNARQGTDGKLRNKGELAEGRQGKALHVEGDNNAILGGVPEIRRTSELTISCWLKPLEHFKRAVVMHRSRAGLDAGCRGIELILEDDRPSFALVHFHPGHEIRIVSKTPLEVNQWTHVTVTYDGSSKAAGMKMYLNGAPAEVEVRRDNLYRDILYRPDWGDDTGKDDGKELGFKIGGRTNDATYKNGLIDELVYHDAALSLPEIRNLALIEDKSKPEDWFDWYAREQDEPLKKLRAELAAVREEENVLSGQSVDLMVMKEWHGPRRPTHILDRGDFKKPKEAVTTPDVPANLLPFPADAPRDRLGFSRWLTDPKNPLTARVAVNRIWQHFFGRGVVATAEDFGTQGTPPSHPELLDHLAVTFMESGWDMKRLSREIVMSYTYGQDSADNGVDPENRLLSRAPRHRLKAEQVRDLALQASGVLVRKIGGPSVKPYQPVGLWEEAGTQHNYVQDRGAKLYRRSFYTFWRRTLPPPTMTIFDAPTREFCKPRRDRTATPLQALVLMNDPQFVEAARLMAQSLVRKHPHDVAARARDAWRLLISDHPTEKQVTELTGYHAEEFQALKAEPQAAATLLMTGEYPADASLPQDDLAATTLMARLIFSYADTTMKP